MGHPSFPAVWRRIGLSGNSARQHCKVVVGPVCLRDLLPIQQAVYQGRDFDRLLSAVNRWAAGGEEKVVAQVGHTTMPAEHIECHDFVSHDRILEWIEAADVVITQGGFGSLRDCLVVGKPTIAVPRFPEQSECQDQQTEIVDALAAERRVIALYDVETLPRAIEDARNQGAVSPYQSDIPAIVAKAVESALSPK